MAAQGHRIYLPNTKARRAHNKRKTAMFSMILCGLIFFSCPCTVALYMEKVRFSETHYICLRFF